MILIAPGTILAMTPKSDLLGGPTKENARTPLSPDGSNGPYKDPKNHATSQSNHFCVVVALFIFMNIICKKVVYFLSHKA